MIDPAEHENRIAVGKCDDPSVIEWAATLEEAQLILDEFQKSDPDGVARGDYYIDAPGV